jgi:poly [ADP-ribose] polymerase 2/3/4
MATVIEEVKLIFADVTDNTNKVWYGLLYDNGDCETRWGRIGYNLQSKYFKNSGKSFLEKKRREKEKKGYSELKTIGSVSNPSVSLAQSNVKNHDLNNIAKSQLIKTQNPILTKLIDRLVLANVHKITANTQITYNSSTGLFATALGIVTMDGLTEARIILSNMAPLIRTDNFGDALNKLVNQYLRIIPQNVGMRLNVRSLLPDDNAIQKQSDLIDSLESSYQALHSTPASKSDKKHETVFKVDMDVLEDKTTRNRLEKWFESSKKSMHRYDRVKVQEIFAVTIHDMNEAFNNKIGNLEEVWHGTSQANCLSILKSGLKTSPPSTAAIAGKMFGNGIYGAKSSSKSMGYTFGRWGQGGTGDSGWLFVCDFAMGKTYTTYNSCREPIGHNSTWARAGQGLQNDELIVYKNNQCNIRYLLEIK